MKRKIAILGLVFFIVNLLTPVATVNATEITDNINTIDESFDSNYIDEDLLNSEEVKGLESEEYAEELNNYEEKNSSYEVIPFTEKSLNDKKYDKEYKENVKSIQFNSYDENQYLDRIYQFLSEDDIVDKYLVLKNKTDDNYEVALSYEDGSYYFINSTNSYDEAMNILNSMILSRSKDSIIPVIINKDGKIVYANSGIGFVVNTSNSNINIYTSSSLKSAYTYANQAYFRDIPVIECTETAAKIQVNGYIGWVRKDDIQIVPMNQATNPSYYIAQNGILYHFISNDLMVPNNSKGNKIVIGVAPDYLKENTYYFSYDGNYFYEGSNRENGLKILVNDLKSNTKDKSVNKNNPYYSYYQYMPFRSKTIYTAEELNKYIDEKTNVTSKLRNIGQALKDAEEKYGVNALLILGVAINESGWGTSNIAQTKNNLFGIKAYDSDTTQASTFNTPGDSVIEFAKNYISRGYANPKDWRYYGGILGNKNLGANVKYASDPYWGEKAAKYAFDVDLYLSQNNVTALRDYNRYKIAVYTTENVVKSSSGITLYNVNSTQRNIGASFIINNNDTVSINGQAMYEIYPDRNTPLSDISFEGEYDWNIKGYVKTSGIKIISDGSNSSFGEITEPSEPEIPTEITGVLYSSHVEDYGWQVWKSNGELSGTSGEAKRLEAIKIKLENYPNASIKYSTHVQDYGWQAWKKDGEVSGSIGESKRLEAIKIEATGLPSNLELQYRVHIQNQGWQNWVSSGEISGSVGKALRLEAIEVRILDNSSISYSTHIQDYGWQSWKNNGELSGTQGEAKRLEAIKIKFDNYPNASVKYSTHVQDYGWQPWKKDGEISGTENQGKRLEAIKIEVSGLPENLQVEYRVHVQNEGWKDWVSNGKIAGTEGKGLRLEGIEIRVVDKTYVKYKSHIQNEGWEAYKTDGEVSGTVGKGLRLEGIIIETENLPKGAYIRYKTHVQNLGWENYWKSEGSLSGTSGKGLRLEAIKIELVGAPGYHVEYRSHVQDLGWENTWKRDGQISGSIGMSKRLEGIQIRIVKY